VPAVVLRTSWCLQRLPLAWSGQEHEGCRPTLTVYTEPAENRLHFESTIVHAARHEIWCRDAAAHTHVTASPVAPSTTNSSTGPPSAPTGASVFRLIRNSL
jgi:hypothetical protein